MTDLERIRNTLAEFADRRAMGKPDEFRALPSGSELRDNPEGMPVLTGHLAVFNEWTEIHSRSEGHFLERLAPGAFTKTIAENRDRMRVLFNHGKDPQIGDKPLGPISSLEVDERGVRYEVPLLDTSYNRDLAEMLRAGVLGSSFRFNVIREDRQKRPAKSDYNPRGLEERTVNEVRMSEFGPVTFPAYPGAGAGLRSLTDRMLGVERADAEDLSTLAQMIQLAACYIGEQDETDDMGNVPAMEAIVLALTDLVPGELSEDEPADEPEDDVVAEEASGKVDAPTDTQAADEHLGVVRREKREPLKYGKPKEEARWRL